MKRAYFIIGAEHAGNRMLNAALTFGNDKCYGDWGAGETFSDLDFSGLPERIAFFRSVPHGPFIENPRPYARLMQLAGYAVTPILMRREPQFVIASHKRQYPKRSRRQVQYYIDTAAAIALEFSIWLNAELIIVDYEPFVASEEYRDELCARLDLPPQRFVEYYDGNEKYRDFGVGI